MNLEYLSSYQHGKLELKDMKLRRQDKILYQQNIDRVREQQREALRKAEIALAEAKQKKDAEALALALKLEQEQRELQEKMEREEQERLEKQAIEERLVHKKNDGLGADDAQDHD